MATYNFAAVADAVIAFKKGITLQQGRALRDNPIAMFEGAVGAPRLQFPALDAAFSTVGGVGSYAFLGRSISLGTYANPGDVIAGSQLQYASVQSTPMAAQVQLSGTSPAGNWRCMGQMENTTGAAAEVATMWLRVS